MFQKMSLVLLMLSMIASANDGKDNTTITTNLTTAPKEHIYIQVASKKAKQYEIYTQQGVLVTTGTLDVESRADVSTLKTGSYLLVIGKKAYQFAIN